MSPSPSLSLVPGFVADAFKYVPITPYQPENVRLDVKTFLPWVRSGLASIVASPAPGQTRPRITVQVDVVGEGGPREEVAKGLTVRGPGDVLAIDPSQIIRRFPSPGTRDAEETFLAHIEFDRPELPWLFTPHPPSGATQERLDPWMSLVVLERRYARFEPGPPNLPMRVRTRKGELQPLNDAWAFAHAQVEDGVGPHDSVGRRADGTMTAGADDHVPSLRDRLSDAHGPVNLSRILCPRRIEDGTHYVACLVPTYDAGRVAGLGGLGGTLDYAWTRTPGDDDEEILLPVYDTWDFSTAPDGDFESLAKRLRPIRAPWAVGRRFISMHRPGAGLPDLAEDAEGRVQVLKCALFSPLPAPRGAPDEDASWSTETREALVDRIEQPERAALASEVSDEDLPRVGPRVYARFQRGSRSVDVDDRDWFDRMNSAPINRMIAGLGTRVVQKDQEPLMQAAWAQVGKIDAANRVLLRAQAARRIAAATHRKFLAGKRVSDLGQITRSVHDKIRAAGTNLSLAGSIARSNVPPAAMDAGLRRFVRARGPVCRRLERHDTAAVDRLAGLVERRGRLRDFRRLHQEPDGVGRLSPGAIRRMPEAASRSALDLGRNVSDDQVRVTLEQRVRPTVDSVADRISSPTFRVPRPAKTVVPGDLVGRRLLERLERAAPKSIETDPTRARALAMIARGVRTSGHSGLQEGADRLSQRLLPEAEATEAPSGSAGTTRPGGSGRPQIFERPGGSVFRPGARFPLRGEIRRDRFRRSGSRINFRPGAARTNLRFRRTGGSGVIGRRRDLAQPSRSTASIRIPDSVASRLVASQLATGGRISAQRVTPLLANTVRNVGLTSIPMLPDRRSPGLDRRVLLHELEPARTITALMRGRIGRFPSWLAEKWFDDGRLRPIMAAPRFDRPMYAALDAYDREWLVPGLGTIDRSDFVTLLETNPEFTENFLLGLSDEMGRELLWRGYPTDQRGTYFHRFWRDDADELKGPIHQFLRTPLGTHLQGPVEGNVVLVVRGELVRRHPDAIMMAMPAVSPEGETPAFGVVPDRAPDAPPAPGEVLFRVMLKPDIMLVGFNLTVARVIAERWWFFIAEHPTAPRFGLDSAGEQRRRRNRVRSRGRGGRGTVDRNDLDWNDVPWSHDGRFMHVAPPALTVRESTDDPPPREVAWPPVSSAVMARILLQNPVRAAYDGAALLEGAGGGS